MASHNKPDGTPMTAQEEAAESARKLAEMLGADGKDSGFFCAILQFFLLIFGGSKDAPDEFEEDKDGLDTKTIGKMVYDSHAIDSWKQFMTKRKDEQVSFKSPVLGTAEVTSGFGHREISYGSKDHKGIDIGARSADKTPSILAAADGVVLFVGRMNGFGNTVVIGHADGSTSLYGHMTGKDMPTMGTEISQGTVIGEMGHSGGEYATHLHFQVSKDGHYVRPKIENVAVTVGTMLKSQVAYAGIDPSKMPKLQVKDTDTHSSQSIVSHKPKTQLSNA